MNQRLDAQGRRAGAAVHGQARALPPDQGLDGVVRRGRRPRAPRAAAVAALVVALLAVPLALVWLDGEEEIVELAGEPAATPETAPTPTPTPAATPTPAEDPEPTPTRAPTPPAPTTAPEEPDPAPTAAPPSGPSAVGAFGTEPVTSPDFPYDGEGIAHLTDVRVGTHDGFDRVVLELTGDGVPGHRISYRQPPITQDGSGDPIDVAGSAYLELLLTPAAGVDFDAGPADGYELTYTGPDRVDGDTRVVTEVVRTGDFEATLTWVVGLRARAPFAVRWLESPLRLVVDIEHVG